MSHQTTVHIADHAVSKKKKDPPPEITKQTRKYNVGIADNTASTRNNGFGLRRFSC